MNERGSNFFRLSRQRNPALNTEHRLIASPGVDGRPFRMGDAAARGHEIHRTGQNVESVAFTVAMRDTAVEQVADGRKPDVRMRRTSIPCPARN